MNPGAQVLPGPSGTAEAGCQFSQPPHNLIRRRLALIVGVLWFLDLNGLIAQQRITTEASTNKWETLEHCRLLEKGSRDGDSFHVRQGDREYVFRLYFVDAPEPNDEEPERTDDQAVFFGLSRAQTLELGREASQFTARELAGEFSVTTRWENGGGLGRLARFYGIVIADGRNLSAELVRNGLARIHGKPVKWPDGPRSTEFTSELKRLELEARVQHRGAWDEKRFPRSTAPLETTPARPVAVDLNSASVGELETLPGIGRKLAERIIATRPYQSVDDLTKVKGIGNKTLEKMRPLVTVKPALKGK